MDNTNELIKLKMNDANSDDDALLDGEDRDGLDNEDEEDMEASANLFAASVEDEADKMTTRTKTTSAPRRVDPDSDKDGIEDETDEDDGDIDD